MIAVQVIESVNSCSCINLRFHSIYFKFNSHKQIIYVTYVTKDWETLLQRITSSFIKIYRIRCDKSFRYNNHAMTVIYYGYILSYEKSFSLKHIFSIWKRCRCMCVSPDKCVNRMEKKESLWSLCYTLDRYIYIYTHTHLVSIEQEHMAEEE